MLHSACVENFAYNLSSCLQQFDYVHVIIENKNTHTHTIYNTIQFNITLYMYINLHI